MTASSGSGFDPWPWSAPRGAERSVRNRRLAWVVAVLTLAFALQSDRASRPALGAGVVVACF